MIRFFYHPKLSFKSIVSSVVLIILVLALPIGVYLVLQNQDPRSKAAGFVVSPEEVALILNNKSSVVSIGQEFDVDIEVKSKEESRIFVARVLFPKELLEVVKISTASAKLNPGSFKILKSDFDNRQGIINIIGGATPPGVKTLGEQIVFATITFEAKQSGDALVKFDDLSQILNGSGQNIIKNKIASQVKITEEVMPKVTVIPTVVPTRNQTVIKVLSPEGGDILPYTKTTQIRWSGSGTERVSVNLYLNGSFLGRIADLVNTESFAWVPSNSLPLFYINNDNVFQIEVKGQDRLGGSVSGLNNGPFGIAVDTQEVIKGPLNIVSVDLNADGKVDWMDFSLFLADFGKSGEFKADLNQDKAVNQMDFLLFQKLFSGI